MNWLIIVALVLLIPAVVFHVLIVRAWMKANAGGTFRISLILFFISLTAAFALPTLLTALSLVPDAKYILSPYANWIVLLRFLVILFHDVALIFLYFQVYKIRKT